MAIIKCMSTGRHGMQVAETGTQVLLMASCTDAGKLPGLLRATGRLDHFIEVGTPNSLERAGMIQHMLALRGLACDGAAVEHVARRSEGFDSSDLSVVIERMVQQRRLAALGGWGSSLRITMKTWDDALSGFQPSAAWEAGMKDAVDARWTSTVLSI
jgi:SpoVK/Ycf46/Vps4 family AAA+-type ATPase